MVILAFGTSGSRVVRSMACPAWCARGSSVKPGVSSALPTLPQCHGTLPDGTQHVALPETELVPRLLSRAPRRPRGIPYPTKHWGLKNTCTASLSVLSPGVGGLERTQGLSFRAPPVPPLQHHLQLHSPESFCCSGRQNPSPKSSTRDPMRGARGIHTTGHPRQL